MAVGDTIKQGAQVLGQVWAIYGCADRALGLRGGLNDTHFDWHYMSKILVPGRVYRLLFGGADTRYIGYVSTLYALICICI